MRIRGFGATDVGRVRDHNEDNFVVDDANELFVVADGVGGHSAGEVASRLLVESVQRLSGTLENLLDNFRAGDARARRQLITAVPQVVQQSSEVIFRHATENPETHGMATTAVVFVGAGSHAFVAHCGDSRLYLLRGEHFRQITEDHTLVRKLIKEGVLTEGDAATHPQRNVIIRSVGMTPNVDCDSLFFDVRPGDLFIMCSDGLTDMVGDAEIHDLALRYHADALVTALIQRANAGGGRDNITVVVLEVDSSDTAESAPDSGAFDLLRKVEFLGDVSMFHTLTEQERIKVNRCLYEEHFPAGTALVTLDEEGDELYIVAAGTCIVEKHGITLAEIPPGGHFGELAFISRDKRVATVRAKTDVTCFVMARQDLHELLQDDTVLGNKLLWAFLESLGDLVRTLSIDLAALKAGLRS